MNRFVQGLLLLGFAACTVELSAQMLPEDAITARPCPNDAHLGFQVNSGTSDTASIVAGADVCRTLPNGSWRADLDVNLVNASGTVTQRSEADALREFHHSKGRVVSAFASGSLDRGEVAQSRALAGAGVGRQMRLKTAALLHIGAHAGLAYTTETTPGTDRKSFPEVWTKADVALKLSKHITLTEVLQLFNNVQDGADRRLDSETDLHVHITDRLSLKTGVELLWDSRPAAGSDQLNLSTYTTFVFAWNKTDE